MSRFWISPHFKKQLKPYCKKHPSLKDDLINTLENFSKIQAVTLGRGVYKLRLKSSDIKRSKSKSFRLIIFVLEMEKLTIPIAIYFKGEQQDISVKEINYHLAIILEELKKK